jgi:hypothetical protein
MVNSKADSDKNRGKDAREGADRARGKDQRLRQVGMNVCFVYLRC